MRSRSNCNLGVLVFVEEGKPENTAGEKVRLQQEREPTTSTLHCSYSSNFHHDYLYFPNEWDNLLIRRAKQKATLMYKCTNNLAPAYFGNLFAPGISNYDLRDVKGKLLHPKPRTDYLKPATHLAILYADRRDRRKSPGVPGAAIAIFADRRDRRIKSPISGMSDIGD